MELAIGPRWERFVEQAVKDGRYGSASDVVLEGLRLVEEREREAKLSALREAIDEGLAGGGEHTEDDVAQYLAEVVEELRREGY